MDEEVDKSQNDFDLNFSFKPNLLNNLFGDLGFKLTPFCSEDFANCGFPKSESAVDDKSHMELLVDRSFGIGG